MSCSNRSARNDTETRSECGCLPQELQIFGWRFCVSTAFTRATIMPQRVINPMPSHESASGTVPNMIKPITIAAMISEYVKGARIYASVRANANIMSV